MMQQVGFFEFFYNKSNHIFKIASYRPFFTQEEIRCFHKFFHDLMVTFSIRFLFFLAPSKYLRTDTTFFLLIYNILVLLKVFHLPCVVYYSDDLILIAGNDL